MPLSISYKKVTWDCYLNIINKVQTFFHAVYFVEGKSLYLYLQAILEINFQEMPLKSHFQNISIMEVEAV